MKQKETCFLVWNCNVDNNAGYSRLTRFHPYSMKFLTLRLTTEFRPVIIKKHGRQPLDWKKNNPLKN